VPQAFAKTELGQKPTGNSIPMTAYYFADGEKVTLIPSRRFVAIRGSEEAPFASIAAKLSVRRQLILPEYGLVVFELQENADDAMVQAIRAEASTLPGSVPGPEVYQLADAPGGEALIPTDEILIRFRPEVSEEEQDRLLARHGVAVRRKDYPEPGTHLAQAEAHSDPIAVAAALHESAAVEFAQPNFVHLTPRLS
jgi:hypothetical protein